MARSFHADSTTQCHAPPCTNVPCGQIFHAYSKQYANSAQDCLEGNKSLPLQRRKAMPQKHLRQDSFLSWAGFEAVCQDFHIITAAVSTVVGPASPNSCPQADHHHRHQPSRGAPLDHNPPSKASPGASASKTTNQPASHTRIFSVETPSSGLLSEVQGCIAFVSACTHRPVVASFPDGEKSDGIVGGENARRDRILHGGAAEERGRISCTEDDAGYWRVSSVRESTKKNRQYNWA